MALRRDFERTITARLRRETQFARAMIEEALRLLRSGETETAQLVMRVLIRGATCAEALGLGTAKLRVRSTT
jgi:hypothetical protein